MAIFHSFLYVYQRVTCLFLRGSNPARSALGTFLGCRGFQVNVEALGPKDGTEVRRRQRLKMKESYAIYTCLIKVYSYMGMDQYLLIPFLMG